MRAIVTGYYGTNIHVDLGDAAHTWEMVEAAYRASCPPWHDGGFVEIARSDKGCDYNAPGVFMVKDREGSQTVVILEGA